MTGERHDRPPRSPAEGPPRARIDRSARDRLGRDLRLFYAGVLEQPLPERFTRLLDDLSAQPTGTSAGTSTGQTESPSREGS